MTIQIRKQVNVGFGNFRQVVLCEVIEGPENLVGRKAIALIFDQLYVSISDLATVPETKREERMTSNMSTALTTTSSINRTTLAVEDPKKNLSSRVPPTRGWTSKIFPDREPPKEVFNSSLSP